MSFRIEEKLSIDTNRIIDFKSFLANKTVKQIYYPRKIQSLYFENRNYEMYTDSLEGLTPRKKIRVRNYHGGKDSKLYLETKISKEDIKQTKYSVEKRLQEIEQRVHVMEFGSIK